MNYFCCCGNQILGLWRFSDDAYGYSAYGAYNAYDFYVSYDAYTCYDAYVHYDLENVL